MSYFSAPSEIGYLSCRNRAPTPWASTTSLDTTVSSSTSPPQTCSCQDRVPTPWASYTSLASTATAGESLAALVRATAHSPAPPPSLSGGSPTISPARDSHRPTHRRRSSLKQTVKSSLHRLLRRISGSNLHDAKTEDDDDNNNNGSDHAKPGLGRSFQKVNGYKLRNPGHDYNAGGVEIYRDWNRQGHSRTGLGIGYSQEHWDEAVRLVRLHMDISGRCSGE